MKKIILKILESCDQAYLQEVMVNYTKKFEEILDKKYEDYKDTPLEFYMLVKEK